MSLKYQFEASTLLTYSYIARYYIQKFAHENIESLISCGNIPFNQDHYHTNYDSSMSPKYTSHTYKFVINTYTVVGHVNIMKL